MLKKHNPSKIRESCELAAVLKKVGLNFVPMPILDNDDKIQLMEEAISRLDILIQQAK